MMETTKEKRRGRPLKKKEEIAAKRFLIGLTETEISEADKMRQQSFDSMAQHIRKFYLLGMELNKKYGTQIHHSVELDKVIAKALKEGVKI